LLHFFQFGYHVPRKIWQPHTAHTILAPILTISGNFQVPVPLISGPTSGRVFEEEIEEWARQARRWTIGASEVFHYFVVKANNIPFFTALVWGIVFFVYYGD
jgi:hypothetical protein